MYKILIVICLLLIWFLVLSTSANVDYFTKIIIYISKSDLSAKKIYIPAYPHSCIPTFLMFTYFNQHYSMR